MPKLSFFDVVILVISLVIGMGIFRAPSTVAMRAGTIEVFYAAWIIGGIVAICGALTFAEAGRRMPFSGAYYRIFAQAYHPALACTVNVIILFSNAASAAGVAIIGSEYVAGWIPWMPPNYIAALLIAVLFGVNLLGLRTSVAVQNILMGLKMAAIAAIVVAPFYLASAGGPSHVQGHAAGLWESIGMALIPVAFTFGGYQSTINFGGMLSSKRGTLSLAIIVGVLMITAIYLATNAAYIHVLGYSHLAESQSIASDVAGALFGSSGANVVTAIMVVSVIGYVNVSMLANPRVISAMSEDGVLPRRFAPSQGASGTHAMALFLFTAVSIVSVFVAKEFERILNYTIFIDAIGLALGAVAVFRLSTVRLPWYVVVGAAVFVASCLFTAVNIFLFDQEAAMYGTALFLVVTFAVMKLLRK